MSFFKKKMENSKDVFLTSPVDGRILPLKEVPDPVFAEKMMGDGIAIECQGNVICAPADGTISLIAQTKHAFGMTLSNGLELLVHVGLETVNLQGEGFQVLSEAGKKVKQGDPILKINIDFMKEKHISLLTPFIIINHQEHPFVDIHEEEIAKAGTTKLFKLV